MVRVFLKQRCLKCRKGKRRKCFYDVYNQFVTTERGLQNFSHSPPFPPLPSFPRLLSFPPLPLSVLCCGEVFQAICLFPPLLQNPSSPCEFRCRVSQDGFLPLHSPTLPLSLCLLCFHVWSSRTPAISLYSPSSPVLSLSGLNQRE